MRRFRTSVSLVCTLAAPLAGLVCGDALAAAPRQAAGLLARAAPDAPPAPDAVDAVRAEPEPQPEPIEESASPSLAPAPAAESPAPAPAADPPGTTEGDSATPPGARETTGPVETSAPPRAAAAQPSAEESDVSPWVPEHERRLLRDHEVDLEKAKFVPGKGLRFVSKNERFALTTRLRAQFLYTFARDGEAGTNENGLQIRRARLVFGGHFWNKHNRFKTELAFSPRDLGFGGDGPRNSPLLDWYVDFTYLRDLSVRVGQFKVPYSRQRVISSGDLQMVDRSIANGEFNLDRDIGIDLHSDDFLGLDKLRYNAGVYFGEGRDQFRPSTFELFYLARLEVLPFGMFEDYEEVDFERSFKPRLGLGAAYAFVDGAQRNQTILGDEWSDGGTADYHNVTADAIFKVAGFSAQGEFFYRAGRRNFGDATVVDEETGEDVPAERELARNGIGWMAQAGFLIPKTAFELSGRYGQIEALGSNTSLEDRYEGGGGLSYYFAAHSMKLQLDYFHLWPPGQRGTDQVRLQLQAAF